MKRIKLILAIVGMILIFHPGMKIFSQGISISNSTSTPDPKAMLDIQSPDKGLLIPRIDLQSSNITTGLGVNQVGLLVFNTNPNYSPGSGFYFWTGIQWQKISDETDLPVNYWDISGSVLYPSDTTNNIGIGTKASGARIVIKSIDGLIKHPQFLFYDPSLLYIGGFGLDTGGNVAMGWNAMGNNTTGWNNIGIGIRPLWSNTTGFGNVALGEQSLRSNTTGFYNTSINNSLYYNTTGFENVGIGISSLYLNTSGNSNVAVGSSALYSNTSGYWNVAIGREPLYHNTTGIENISIGNYTLYSNTVGTDNLAIMAGALQSNVSGTNNIALGSACLSSNMTGSFNTAMGRYALYNNQTGSYNIAIGDSAGYNTPLMASYRMYIGCSDSTKAGIYFYRDNGWGRWNGTLLVKTIPVLPSQPSYVLAPDVNGVVSKFPYPIPTPLDSIPFERNPSGGRIYLRNLNDKTGLGTSTPEAKLEIKGSLKVDSCAYFALKDNGNSGTTLNVNWNAGNIQKLIRTGNCTVNMTAPPGATRLTLLVNHENSSVPYTLTFSPAPKWPGGVAPTFTNTTGAVDIITFVYDGIAYYGTIDNDFK